MRITGFHVDGFGLLHDQGVTGIGPGTTVVLGPNEAGKSTLHAFLVRTLFGHPRANDAEGRNRHEPLRGGRHGGVVHCRDEAGSWAVHRFTEGSPRLRVVAPDGTEHTGTDAVLPLLGRTVDETRYEQVFAIDLDDLAGIGSLGGGSLDDLLFDAATVGTGRSLRAARDEAIERRDALWTPTACKRPLAAAMARRARARSALAAARDAARDNVDLRRRLDEASARVDELAARQEEVAARAALLERVRDAWPAWSRAAELRTALADQPEVDVDAQQVEAARHAAAAAAAAEQRFQDLTADREELDARIDRCAVDEDALAVAAEVEALAEGVGAHELALEQQAAAEAERDRAADAVAAAGAALGPSWEQDRLDAVTIGAPARERLVAAGEAVRATTVAAAAAEEAAEEAARVAARRDAAVQEAASRLPAAATEEEVAAAEEALAVLRAGVAARPPVVAAAGGRSSAAPGIATALLVAGLVVLVPAVGGVLPGGIVAVAGALVGAVLAAAGAYLLGTGRRSDPAAAPVATTAPGGDVATAAARLGLSAAPTVSEVERVAVRVDAARRARRDRVDAERHLDQLQAEAREARRLADDRAAVARERGAAADAAAHAWQTACDDLGLVADDVGVVLAVHDRVAAVRRAQDDLTAAAARVERGEPRVEQFRADATAVVGKLGHDERGQAVVRLLPTLRERVRAARAEQTERTRLVAERDELDRRLEAARAALATARAEQQTALRAAGATDLDDLEDRARLAATRADMAADLTAAERAITELLGAGPRGEEGRRLLATADPAAWEQELAATATARATLAAERDDALAERTRLEAALRRVGGDDAVPRAEQDLAAAEVEVAELAEEWAVADTAARLLEATVARFEREQQPRVLTRASELLARATGGQWAQVRRLDEQVVVARSQGGDPVPADVLSRGTREQLWLCLRLALAEDLAQDRPLPLLVDDLLGTSDPERSLHVARVLAEVARHQQVWLFTCHPRTAELVTSVDPTAGVLRLRRGGHVVGLTRRDAPSQTEPGTPTPTLFAD